MNSRTAHLLTLLVAITLSVTLEQPVAFSQSFINEKAATDGWSWISLRVANDWNYVGRCETCDARD